ncbi:hypothetical protein [Rhizobium leguminosarum]
MKYPSSTLLKSSIDLGWSFLSAELLTHHPYEGPGAAAPPDAEVGIVIRGSDEALTYKGAGDKLTLTVSSPMQVHGIAKEPARRAPGLGEHNHEILKELGFDPAQIEKLHAAITVPRG